MLIIVILVLIIFSIFNVKNKIKFIWKGIDLDIFKEKKPSKKFLIILQKELDEEFQKQNRKK